MQAGRIPVTFGGGIAIARQPVGDPKPPLLDVADMLACCAAHACSAEAARDRDGFLILYRAFQPLTFAFGFDPQVLPAAQAESGAA